MDWKNELDKVLPAPDIAPADKSKPEVKFNPRGGFQVSRFTGDFEGKATAHFDRTGKLIDAGLHNKGENRPVKKNSLTWDNIGAAGLKAAEQARAEAAGILLEDEKELEIVQRILNAGSRTWLKEYHPVMLPHLSPDKKRLVTATIEGVNLNIRKLFVEGAVHFPPFRRACNNLNEKIEKSA